MKSINLAVFKLLPLIILTGCLESGSGIQLSSDPIKKDKTTPTGPTPIEAAPSELINPIAISMSPSRISGVAPLAVFFDATATVAPKVTLRPFHDLEYRWNFGDVSSGNWGDKSTGSNGTGANTNRNQDLGPVAAHVFDKPGTYTVTLTVVDGTNTKSMTTTITVIDPNVEFVGTKTICFSDNLDYTGCPAAAIHSTTTDFVAAMTNVSSYKRLLFRRGGVWTANNYTRITAAGPGLISDFGDPNLPMPMIRLIWDGDLFQIGGASFSDWRICNLDLNLNSPEAAVNSYNDPVNYSLNFTRALKAIGNANDFLMQNLNVHNGQNGLTFSDPSAAPGWDKIFVVDSTFQDLRAHGNNGSAIFASAFRMAWMGNKVERTRGHNARFPFIGKGVVSHNFHSDPGHITSNLKIHAPDFPTQPGYTEHVVVSSNKFYTGSADWMIELQPQSRHNDERIRNVIVEKNFFQAAPPYSTHPETAFNMPAISVSGSGITLRNNITDLTQSEGTAFEVGQFGACAVACEPKPENIEILNNTFFTNMIYKDGTMKVIKLRAETSATAPTKVKNNLAYAPKLTSAAILVENLATNTMISNNSSDSNIRMNAPAWRSLSPASLADFSLAAPTYLSGDSQVSVLSDFFGVSRNRMSMDIGATEFP